MSGAPDPKSRSLARGERRHHRKVASPKRWAAIIDAKGGPCRVCGGKPETDGNQDMHAVIHFHHLVPRAQGGDDTEDNIVPLCSACHHKVTTHQYPWTRPLAESLSDAEYAYVIGKLGESGPARLFGVGR